MKDGGEWRKKKGRGSRATAGPFPVLSDGARGTNGGISFHEMKAAARLPSPVPSPPLLISPSTHTCTPWSPLATRNTLYTFSPSAASCAPPCTYSSFQTNKQSSTKTLCMHLKGTLKTGAKISRRWNKCTSPETPSKHPLFFIMSPTHRFNQTSHTDGPKETPHFFLTSGAANRKCALLPGNSSTPSAPNLLALTRRHAHLDRERGVSERVCARDRQQRGRGKEREVEPGLEE